MNRLLGEVEEHLQKHSLPPTIISGTYSSSSSIASNSVALREWAIESLVRVILSVSWTGWGREEAGVPLLMYGFRTADLGVELEGVGACMASGAIAERSAKSAAAAATAAATGPAAAAAACSSSGELTD